MAIKTQNHQKNKGQNRPSEIRLSGVPPIMLIKPKKTKKRQNKPSEIRLSRVPPIMPMRTKKKYKNVKIDPQKNVYQGSPYNAYQNLQIKKTKSQNRPSEIRLSGIPPIMLRKKLKKQKTKTPSK